jgi:hypothetical protein
MNQAALSQCRYHSDHQARWQCESCQLDLCLECRPFAERLPDPVHCPLCNQVMQDLEIGAPFWTRPHRLLAYPSTRIILALLAALAVISMLLPPGFGRVAFSLPAFVALSWLAFHALIQSVSGDDSAPEVDQLKSFDQVRNFALFLVVISPYALIMTLTYLIGPLWFRIAALMLIAVAMPASIMIIHGDDRLDSAFNHARIIDLIKALDHAYAILAGFVFMLLAIPAILSSLLDGLIPAWINRGLLVALLGYGFLVGMHLIGHALFQYRRQFDAINADQNQDLTAEKVEPEQALTNARIQTREQQHNDARWTLGQALAHYPNHAELNRQFEQLLVEAGDDSELHSHLERRLLKLVNDGQDELATDSLLRNRKMLGQWLPKSPRVRHVIASVLAERGQPRDALKLLLTLPKDAPKYQFLAEACLLAAKILEQHMDDRQAADKLRGYVRKRFPGRSAQWEQDDV